MAEGEASLGAEAQSEEGRVAMRRFTRRDVVVSAAVAPALLLPRSLRAAAAFPARSIQFIIPYGAGGGFDTFVRYVSPVMETHLPNKVSIVPLNIATGGGMRGITQLYRSRPDGHTIGIFDMPGMFVQQAVHGANGYDMDKFSWVGCMGEGERYLVGVGMNSPLKNFDDLKALSAQRPVKFAVTGLDGTATAACIIGTELLGIRRQLITGYRGSSEFIVAAIRGDSDAVISAMSTMMKFARGNQIRILASFETKSSIPGIPDATSLGRPELDAINVERPIAGPPGLPVEIQNILSGALAKALAEPRVIAWAKDNDITMLSKTPQQTVALVARQRAFFDKWRHLLVAA
jgi:tripartite-type tricarboxylate transporter receptor subunit TctC